MSAFHVKQEGKRVTIEIATDWSVTTYVLERAGPDRSSLRITGDMRRIGEAGRTDAALVVVPESARTIVLALL